MIDIDFILDGSSLDLSCILNFSRGELIHEAIPRMTEVNHPDPYPYYGNANANVLDSYRLLARHIANNDFCSCFKLFGFKTILI